MNDGIAIILLTIGAVMVFSFAKREILDAIRDKDKTK